MLYYLFYVAQWPFYIHLFKYISFRGVMAACTSFIIVILIAPKILSALTRTVGKKSTHVKDLQKLTDIHSKKQGTPNMGGIIIIAASLTGILLFCDLSNPYIIGGLYVISAFGLLGFIDDYLKLFSSGSKGLSKKQKLAWQFFITSMIALLILRQGYGYYKLYPVETYAYIEPHVLSFPVFKNLLPELGAGLYLFWTFLVVGGASNAVNLTDGLDGLAVGCMCVVIITLGIMAYVVSRVDSSEYLKFLFVRGGSELVIFCLSVGGSCLGFLWFNGYPAQVFMGDTGSLFLGACAGYVALVIKQEFILVLIGGIFVVETGSVIIQVFSFKVFGKRVFKVAPLHHHFELKGLTEPKITVRFWIVQIILALVCLSSMKLR